MSKITCLDQFGQEKRPIELNRNDYKSYDEYNVTHKDALSDGDPQGKGTGSAGHTHSTPDCDKAEMNDSGHLNSPIDYSNFDTEAGGGSYDIKGRDEISFSGRERLTNINIYNKNNEYGANFVNTEENIVQGQVVIK